MQDNFGRSMEYLRLSITDRCNLRCRYCMPEAGCVKQPHENILRNEEIIRLVTVMAELGVKKVRLTGGEPLVRKGLPAMIEGLNQIENIQEVTLTTNGLLLESQIEELKSAGLSRINISVDSLNPDTYHRITRGGDLTSVLRGIEKARIMGIKPIKVNVVLIKGENDHEVDTFLNAFDPSIEVRFIELMPIGEAATWNKEKFININKLFSKRLDLIPAIHLDNGGPCRYYKHLKTGRYVGIINSISNHFCEKCNRLRVTSDGILKTCLHGRSEVYLKSYLDNPFELKKIILQAVGEKPRSHNLDQINSIPILRNMYTIGG